MQARLGAIVVAATLAACAAPLERGPAAIAPTPDVAADLSTPRAIHEALVIPGSNLLFTAESEPPADDADWTAVRAGAQQVIDGAVALQADGLAQGRADWIAHAQTVIDNTRLTAQALAQNNADDLVFTNGDMMSGCTACHQTYRQPVQ